MPFTLPDGFGFIPAFEADMAALADNYGRMAAKGKACRKGQQKRTT
jgi:hypothetical protein